MTEREHRPRAAPRASASSDVTRFRGVLLATLVTAASAVAIGGIALGADGLRSPGALSRPHREAEIACATCHDAAEPAAACATCHAGHASRRAGHRAATEGEALGCPTCHRAHDARGLTFAPDGAILSSHGGVDDPVESTTGFRPPEAMHVTLVPRAACEGCHALDLPEDPAARCFQALSPSLCFDEHATSLSERSAAWEAARAVVVSAPAPTERSSLVPWALVLGAGALGALALLLVRVASRRRARAPVALPVVVEKVRLPQVDTTTCLGCYACVDACPYDVLAIERYVAVVVRPKDCCGLTLCEQVCPNGSLQVMEGALIEDRPRVAETLESLDRPGLYLAGDLTGAPLMRNAIEQGAAAVRELAGTLRRGEDAHDVVIVGAGPAGLSAALEAKARSLDYVVLEQGSVAESIRSFPRGKLVFDQPIHLPRAGELWLEECSKEELLAKWTRIVRKERLAIRERHRVTAVEPEGEGFVIRALDEHGAELVLRARRVVLALGRRGTPRKLAVPIPDEALDRVHYALADARSHGGARVVVVGLGDVAMEAAVALARQPGTTVTLVHRGEGFARGKARNVAEVERGVREGRIALHLATEVEAVRMQDVLLRASDGTEARLAYDAMFVLIGSLPPWPFLEAAGVRRVGDQRERGGRTRPAGGSSKNSRPE